MKRFKIHFKNSDQSTMVEAHHFAESVGGDLIDFFKDEKEKDKEIYVRKDSVAAITTVEPPPPPRTSTSTSSFR